MKSEMTPAKMLRLLVDARRGVDDGTAFFSLSGRRNCLNALLRHRDLPSGGGGVGRAAETVVAALEGGIRDGRVPGLAVCQADRILDEAERRLGKMMRENDEG